MVLENTSAMPDDAALFKTKERGRSSGVERNLAKVEAVGSNPIARSIFSGPLLNFPAALLGLLANRMV